MTSKLSFRSRQLDPSKPMPIYRAEELPDLGECTAISRGVPVLPSGMEKEEEGVSIEPNKNTHIRASVYCAHTQMKRAARVFINTDI